MICAMPYLSGWVFVIQLASKSVWRSGVVSAMAFSYAEYIHRMQKNEMYSMEAARAVPPAAKFGVTSFSTGLDQFELSILFFFFFWEGGET